MITRDLLRGRMGVDARRLLVDDCRAGARTIARLTDHPWSIGELLDAALGYEPSKPRPGKSPNARGFSLMFICREARP